MPEISIGRFRGGFCVYWHDISGIRRRYQLAALSRKDAEPEALEVYRRHAPEPTRMTVAQVWAAYMADLGDKPITTTMRSTGKPLLAHFGAFATDQVDRDMCRDYADKRLAGGRKQGAVHTELGHLRNALNFGVRSWLIDRVPHMWIPTKPSPKERWLTEPEIGQLLDATSAPHIRLAVHLMLATAGRVGSILDLTWDRVDFERGQINLRLPDAISRKGRAVVPMNAGLRAALTVSAQAALSDFVVEYAGGQVACIRKGFTNAVDRAGLKDVTIHTLRHSAAVHMAAAGVPLDQVGQYLGHSNVATTYRVYARFAPDHLRKAAEILDFVKLKVVGSS